ncbi:MAG TPA: helix-hairpin-helix domain-containing protein [Fimbriimonadaceae bacterium]|nr:helix-hairpin-helix domain-containing protein [Fimbriimonadaceae bacterium]HRJ96098.1 helix-hairpin-helix domain-containing protein [Fimbriimonadaceae bacterium]
MSGAWNNRQSLGLGLVGLVGAIGVGYIGSGYFRQPDAVGIAQGKALPTQAGDVVVHVTGAVAKPGLVTLSGSARINDAIEKAGGPTKDADLGAVNLAAKVIDGMQIVVARHGDEVASSVSMPDVSTKTGAAAPEAAPGGQISINGASAIQLEELPGVGPAIAARIVEYRQANGGFKSIDELERVKGIGPKKLDSMRPYVRL